MDILLLMTIDKKECQTVHTHKEDNCRKLSHTAHIDHYNTSSQPAAEDRAHGKHQWLTQLVWHFRTMWADVQPTVRKTLSTGWAGRNSQNYLTRQHAKSVNVTVVLV